METVNVMPWGEDQGDYVVINKDDFDPKKHKLYKEKEGKKKQGEDDSQNADAPLAEEPKE